MSIRTLIVWCLLWLVPMQSFASVGALPCHLLSETLQTVAGGTQPPTRQPIGTLATKNLRNRSPVEDAPFSNATVNTQRSGVTANLVATHHHQQNRSDHKHFCCDGMIAVVSTSDVPFAALVGATPRARQFAALVSVFLAGLERPPRSSIA
jgi:hypothetical protein